MPARNPLSQARAAASARSTAGGGTQYRPIGLLLTLTKPVVTSGRSVASTRTPI